MLWQSGAFHHPGRLSRHRCAPGDAHWSSLLPIAHCQYPIGSSKLWHIWHYSSWRGQPIDCSFKNGIRKGVIRPLTLPFESTCLLSMEPCRTCIFLTHRPDVGHWTVSLTKRQNTPITHDAPLSSSDGNGSSALDFRQGQTLRAIYSLAFIR